VKEAFPVLDKGLQDLYQKDLFFVCGVIKSGTTWLERLLDSHPEVVCKGEGHFGSDLYSLMSTAFEEYNASMPLKGKAFAHSKLASSTVSASEDLPIYSNEDKEFIVFTSISLMMSKWLSRQDDPSCIKCVGDKTPSNLTHIELLNHLNPDAKFIHIIRDGRDVAVSAWNFNMNTDLGATIQQWGSFRKFVPWAAEAWANEIKPARVLAAKKLGNRYYELRYEDLLTNPEREAKKLFQFLNVDDSYGIVEELVDMCKFERMSGGRKPGEEDMDSFYRKGIAGDWKNYMDDNLLQLFLDKAGDVLADCDYV
jgi:hypothetical protein